MVARLQQVDHGHDGGHDSADHHEGLAHPEPVGDDPDQDHRDDVEAPLPVAEAVGILDTSVAFSLIYLNSVFGFSVYNQFRDLEGVRAEAGVLVRARIEDYALHAASSWPAWSSLRDELKLDVSQAASVLRLTLDALLRR